MKHTPCEIIIAPRASERVHAVATFLEKVDSRSEALLLAPSREAADDVLRKLACVRGSIFGVHRLTLQRLAGLLASERLSEAGLVPAASLAIEAVAARVV